MSSGSAGALYRPVLALCGAVVGVLALYAGSEPGPLLARLQGTSVTAVLAFAALTAGGLWLGRVASASAWRWAAGIGVALSTAALGGLALRRLGGLVPLLVPENLAWVVVHWLGLAWILTLGLAALIRALDHHPRPSVADQGVAGGQRGPARRLVAALRAAEPARRRRGLLVVMGVLVLSRLPYLAVYWPGIMPFDTIRSYSYARGTRAWETYEPVGHSLLITAMQWTGTTLGWGDAGGLAIGAVSAILGTSAAFTFLLSRMAVWGLSPRIWLATFAWLVLLPVFGYYGVQVGKDVPFSVAMIVFLVGVGEVSLGRPSAGRKVWPWVVLTVAAVGVVVLRNNGIHVLALTLPVLLVVLWRFWKRWLVVAAAVVVAYALYTGPLYATLGVHRFPREEPYSVPLQQLGRITKYHWADLSTADQEFISDVFSGRPPGVLAQGYVPWLADPMKLSARDAWDRRSTTEFLAGWARIVVKYPGTAVDATLANTVGFWDPEAPSYDGLIRWSANDARDIHLDIPSGKPTEGIAGMIESSGIMPTRSYRNGLDDNGYRAVPVLGHVMSPGAVCWAWLIAALLVLRRRDRAALAVFVPAGALLLSFLAGPVSGGQRYALTLFMALPIAVAAVVLARRPGDERRAVASRLVEERRNEAVRRTVAADLVTPVGPVRTGVRTGSRAVSEEPAVLGRPRGLGDG